MTNEKIDKAKHLYTKDTMVVYVLENEDTGNANYLIYDDGARKPYIVIQCEMAQSLADGKKVPVKIISFRSEIIDMAQNGEIIAGKLYRVHGDWQQKEWTPINGNPKILNTLMVNHKDDFMECNSKMILKDAETKTRCAISGTIRGKAMTCLTQKGRKYTKIPFSVNLGDESITCNICITDEKQIEPLLKQCEKIGEKVRNVDDILVFDIIGTFLNRDKDTGRANIWADHNTRQVETENKQVQEVASYAISYDAKPENVNTFHPKSKEKYSQKNPNKTKNTTMDIISDEDMFIDSLEKNKADNGKSL